MITGSVTASVPPSLISAVPVVDRAAGRVQVPLPRSRRYGWGSLSLIEEGLTLTSAALSVQLYAVRDQLTEDLDGTLARLAAMGLQDVEAFDFVDRATALAEGFKRNGLRARTGHASLLSEGLGFDDPALAAGQAGPPRQDTVFEAAKTVGLEIVIDPFVELGRWLSEDEVLATAKRLNDAAERASDHGLRVGYHNHSQEFVASFRGLSAYEFFAEQLRDDVVLEVDLYWAATARQDVSALLGRLGDKVKALHLKDGVVGDDPFRPGRHGWTRPPLTSVRPARATCRCSSTSRPPRRPSSA